MSSRTLVSGQACLRCQSRLLQRTQTRPRPRDSLRLEPVPVQLVARRRRHDEAEHPSPWGRLEDATTSERKKDILPKPSKTKPWSGLNDWSTTRPDQVTDSYFRAETGAPSKDDASPPPSPPSSSTSSSSVQEQPAFIYERIAQDKRHRGPRGHRGRVGSRRVVLQSENLDVDMLGAKAHTIVMRDDQGQRQSQREIKEAPAPAPTETDSDHSWRRSAQDMEAAVEASQREATPEETLANIDALRPSTDLLPRAEFWDLLMTLEEGFTATQMKQYLRQAHKKRRLAVEKGEQPIEALTSAPASRQVRPPLPWMAAPFQITPVEDLRGAKDMPAKARQAFSLLRDVWDLDIWERVEGLSETEIKLRHSIAVDLHRSEDALGSLLAKLRRDLLQRGERINFNKNSMKLEIVAARMTIETIIQEIDSLLTLASEETYALLPPTKDGSQNPAANLNGLPLRELCAMTNTILASPDHMARREGLIRICWFRNKDDPLPQESPFETMGHVVWRLLFTAYHHVPTQMMLNPTYHKSGSGCALQSDTSSREQWPWEARLDGWSRFVAPIHREPKSLLDKASVLEVLRDLVEGADNDVVSHRSASASSVTTEAPQAETQPLSWSEPEETTRMLFGHVLFKNDAAMKANFDKATTTQTAKDAQRSVKLIAAEDRRIFSPVIPPPSGLAPLNDLVQAEGSDRGFSSKAAVVLRFAAGLDLSKHWLLRRKGKNQAVLEDNSIPSFIVELQLDVPDQLPPDGRLTWNSSPRKHVRAVLGSNNTDVPLPDRPVDVRLSREYSSSLHDPEAVPFLREFIDKSDLNLAAGDLITPPRVAAPLDTFAGVPSAPASASNRGTLARRDLVDMKAQVRDKLPSPPPLGYEHLEFIGLEIQRAAEVDWQGHKLRYETVDAGLHGGRRTELSLMRTLAREVQNGTTNSNGIDALLGEDDTSENGSTAHFAQLALDLADGRLVKWFGGQKP